ncbi:MAG: hypothetical protein HYT42_02340 [Candidatus Sungbacteria bacterium]|nr:hypothetical protein [Candidatus Sungbacteria bacterium]
MKGFVFLLIAAVGIYAIYRYVPTETKRKTLAAVGAADFFQETLPRFLREKLSIPENPEVKRKKLIDELSKSVDAIDRELNTVSPPADTKAEAAVKLPTPSEIKGKVEEVRELLSKSEETIKQLGDANSGESVLRKAALGLVDKVFPPAVENSGGRTAACPTP